MQLTNLAEFPTPVMLHTALRAAQRRSRLLTKASATVYRSPLRKKLRRPSETRPGPGLVVGASRPCVRRIIHLLFGHAMLYHHVPAHRVHRGELQLANGTAGFAIVLLHVSRQRPPVAVAHTADGTTKVAPITCREETSPGWSWFRFGKGIKERSGI